MAEVKAIIRKWGDSLAIIIPKDIAKLENMKPNQKVNVIVKKNIDLSDLFGKWKTKKTAQDLKNESREDWV